MPPIIYLLDGHALAYRAYFALTRGSSSAFTTHAGEPTAGVFGFTSILLRLLEQDHPDYMAVTFDTGKTFRDDLFPEYKGTRAKMPEDLRPQMERIRQIVDSFNIPRLEMEGYEADDVLGSLSRHLASQGFGVKIITGDRDLLQLVDDRILVNLPGKSIADAKDYFPKDVVELFGVKPEQVVDYKALVGDKSDNIPGVAGIGEKTASSLLQTYNTLDGIYSHLSDLSESIRKKLEANKKNAYLSQKLATIVTDLKVQLDLDMARTEHFDPARVEALFRELEFRALMGRLTALYTAFGKSGVKREEQLSLFTRATAPSAPAPKHEGEITVHVVDDEKGLNELVHRLQSAKIISFDTETTSTDQMRADLVGISLAVDGNEGWYIPVGHEAEPAHQLQIKQVIDALQGPLTDVQIPKVGHNLKYDFVMLARNGLRPSPLAFDTMIAEWLTNPTSHNLGLKNLAWVRLDFRMTEITSLIGTGKKQISMAQVPIDKAASYAAMDAIAVIRLMPGLQTELKANSAVKLFDEIEMPLIPVLADMEMTGIALDINFLKNMSGELQTRMSEIETNVFQHVGERFNINSTQQLSNAIFNQLKLAPPEGTRRTDSGHYSTSAEVLEALQGKHPVVDLLLEYRELSKLKSTYLDALPQQVNPRTARVHTSYNQAGSVTGRIASSDPNLQNIPIRTELGRQVRQAFIAGKGLSLLSVDYSQVELRIAAHMSKDEAMLAAFRADQDIHTATAAAILGTTLDKVTKEQRRNAKAINFGLLYGMSAFGLTRTSDLTLAEAEDFVEAYFKQFPGVKSYLDNMRRSAARQGYVETLLGRRRYFPGLKSGGNPATRAREEREAINAPIQGTAADIMKIAMIQVASALREAGLSGHMLLQVHDELVLECPPNQLKKTAKIVRTMMENAYNLAIPLKTEARDGHDWGNLSVLED
ncbi:MAG: DNA polymerase I [Chloroflexi bacterium RBG_16_47_49]|nr:MAG: DNA polymerase I [Chloroflexi bacterium RBG_16_47_49]